MEFQEKKSLVEKISLLSKEAHIEIFFFLKKHVSTSHYTLTRNGAFFNINQLSHKILLELKDLVDFCSQNEDNLKLTHPDKKNVTIEKCVQEEDDEEDDDPPPQPLPPLPPLRKPRASRKKSAKK